MVDLKKENAKGKVNVYAFVKKLSNEQIELSLTEQNTIKIQYTDSEGFLQCMNAEEFPIIKDISSPERITVKKYYLIK